MVLKLANNAVSTLQSSISSSATAIEVAGADAGKFPTLGVGDWHPATLKDLAGNMEIVKVTARSGTTLTVVRGQEGTTARAFASGSKIEVRLTAAALADKASQADVDTKAPLASPAFTGNPTAPTASPGDNDTTIATTGFVTAAVTAAVNAILGGVSSAFDTLAEIAAALALKADKAITISVGGIATGGGDLTASRSITVPKASQAEAEAGTDDAKAMTAARVKDSILANVPPSIGIDQTWQNVSGSRAAGTAYQNTTGRAIMVAIRARSSSNGVDRVAQVADNSGFSVGLVEVGSFFESGTSFIALAYQSFIVPPGKFYRINGAVTNMTWSELR